MYTRICIYCIHTYVCICMHVCVFVCEAVCIYIYIYIYIYFKVLYDFSEKKNECWWWWWRFVWFFIFSIHYSTHTLIPPSLNTVFRLLAPILSLSHSPESGRIGARRATFLDSFLAQPPSLLPGRPRPVRIWLILDLARTGCPDSENQDTLDNSLWWRYLRFEWQYASVSFSSLVPTAWHRLLLFTFHPCNVCTYPTSFWTTPFWLSFF